MVYPAGWAVSDSKANDTAIVTKAAGGKHVIYSLAASFDNTVTGKKVTLKAGNDVVWEAHIYTSGSFTFPRGVSVPAGVAISAELEASGDSGITGTVSLHGVTI